MQMAETTERERVLIKALTDLGEAYHGLSDEPAHQTTMFILRPGHGPGIAECSDYHCARARDIIRGGS